MPNILCYYVSFFLGKKSSPLQNFYTSDVDCTYVVFAMYMIISSKNHKPPPTQKMHGKKVKGKKKYRIKNSSLW